MVGPTLSFIDALEAVVDCYLAEIAGPSEFLSLLRWQIAERHALDRRDTLPGHVTTSGIVLSHDHRQVLLIDHVAVGRWLQPGGHYEDAARFSDSAAREVIEETGAFGLRLHPWHGNHDTPFVIDTHDVPGRSSRNERDHVHHDLQYLFVADPSELLVAQLDEVKAARWHFVESLATISPVAMERIAGLAGGE